MITVEETSRGLRAVDDAKNEVEVELEGWEPGGVELTIHRRVDATLHGLVRRVILPGKDAYIESDIFNKLKTVKYDEQYSLPASNHLIQTDDILTTFLRAHDSCSVDCDISSGTVNITFNEPTSVTIGFRSHIDLPKDTIRVPPTPDGIAFGISSLGRAHRTETPDRSYPSMRGYPPLIRLNGAAGGPADTADSKGSIRVRVPPRRDFLYCIAPLAYYLGAEVQCTGGAPCLEFEERTLELPRKIGKFSKKLRDILTRVFYLDCLTRNAGPYGFDIVENRYLDELSIDADEVYPMPMSERLRTYLSVEFDAISSNFPRWPLSISLDSCLDNVSAIPHLAYSLALIFPALGTPVDRCTVISNSIGNFKRSASTVSNEQPFQAMIEMNSQPGMLNGWISDGIPLNGFKAVPSAYTNRVNASGGIPPRAVAVVINDRDMEEEFSVVVDAYHERRTQLSIDLDLHWGLSIDEMRSTFQMSYDVIHYIGHCDAYGLRCHDGYFSCNDLPETRVTSTFINACDSYDEGLAFIKKGGVACGVTIGEVLDEQAKKVGSTFARLLGQGFNLGTAVMLARTRTIMNHQYVILGDGTFITSQSDTSHPTAFFVSSVGNNTYSIEPYLSSPTLHGSITHSYPESGPTLAGNRREDIVDIDQLRTVLEGANLPVILDGRFCWSDELLRELGV